MSFASHALPLSDSLFVILRDLIHERAGLYFESTKQDILAEKLSPRVIELGLSSFLDYYYLLKYDAAANEEWRVVMDALAVPETYFWRELDQVRTLVDQIMPALAQARQPVRIWSAACASGEEPLTIAMALNEAGWFERLPVWINASDASQRAIARAGQGIYRERSFRSLPPELREKYFTPHQGGWRVDPLLQARITFRVANLVSEHEIADLAAAQVVFCRNVFLYFSADTMRTVACHFYKHMLMPGYLFLGAAESLLRITSAFELQELGRSFVYVKQPDRTGRAED